MPQTDRPRIDYMPGKAAREALYIAQDKFPNLRSQALIDKLILCGLSALLWDHWTPPALFGKNRDKWRLPEVVKTNGTDSDHVDKV